MIARIGAIQTVLNVGRCAMAATCVIIQKEIVPDIGGRRSGLLIDTHAVIVIKRIVVEIKTARDGSGINLDAFSAAACRMHDLVIFDVPSIGRAPRIRKGDGGILGVYIQAIVLLDDIVLRGIRTPHTLCHNTSDSGTVRIGQVMDIISNDIETGDPSLDINTIPLTAERPTSV